MSKIKRFVVMVTEMEGGGYVEHADHVAALEGLLSAARDVVCTIAGTVAHDAAMDRLCDVVAAAGSDATAYSNHRIGDEKPVFDPVRAILSRAHDEETSSLGHNETARIERHYDKVRKP